MKKEELEKIAAEMKAREKLGTNIGAVIYDVEPDIKTLIRTKSSGGETLGRFASFMDRPLLQPGFQELMLESLTVSDPSLIYESLMQARSFSDAKNHVIY